MEYNDTPLLVARWNTIAYYEYSYPCILLYVLYIIQLNWIFENIWIYLWYVFLLNWHSMNRLPYMWHNILTILETCSFCSLVRFMFFCVLCHVLFIELGFVNFLILSFRFLIHYTSLILTMNYKIYCYYYLISCL